MIDRDSRWQTAADVRFRIVGGEGVAVRQASGEAIVLDEVGARILRLLERGPTVGELLRLLEDEYEVEPERLAEDVEGFLDELAEAGLIARAEDPGEGPR